MAGFDLPMDAVVAEAGFDVETVVVEVVVVVFADAGVGPAAGLAVGPAVELVGPAVELAVAPGVAGALAVALVVAPGVAGVAPAVAEPASCVALAPFSR